MSNSIIDIIMFSGGTTKAGIENAKGIIDNKD